MPHSSGGGSHGGGSHGGGGSGGSAGPRVSRKPYAGARRYIYYYPGTDRYEYLYYSGAPVAPTRAQLVPALFMAVILLLVALFLASTAFVVPKAVDLNSYDSAIRIEDRMSLLDDTDGLYDALLDFQTLTGVTPAIEVVTHADWEDHYTDLETFAYSEYLRCFDDEKHWLFVFSFPENTDADFIDWAWEGMIGDDVGGAITSAAEEDMTQLMQKYLLRADADGLANAIGSAFRALSENVMEPYTDYGAFASAAMPLLFAVLVLVSTVSEYKRKTKLAAAFPLGYEAPREHNCAYCGCMYVEGTVSVCPHCGAPIPAADPSEAL